MQIHYIHTQSAAGHRNLVTLPGQEIAGKRKRTAIRSGILVKPSRKAEKDFARRWKAYPAGTVFACTGLAQGPSFATGGCYVADEIFPVSHPPVRLEDTPSEEMLSGYENFKTA